MAENINWSSFYFPTSERCVAEFEILNAKLEVQLKADLTKWVNILKCLVTLRLFFQDMWGVMNYQKRIIWLLIGFNFRPYKLLLKIIVFDKSFKSWQSLTNLKQVIYILSCNIIWWDKDISFLHPFVGSIKYRVVPKLSTTRTPP